LRNAAAIRGLSTRDLGKKAALSDATMSNAAAGAALRSPRSIGAGRAALGLDSVVTPPMSKVDRVTAAYPEPPPPARGDDLRLLYSVADAAEVTGLSRASLYKLMTCGELESISVFRRRLIPRVCIEAFIARRLTVSNNGATTGSLMGAGDYPPTLDNRSRTARASSRSSPLAR
jgi:hypothetical protein